MSVTTAIVPDKRRPLQPNKTKEKKTFNICIRVTFERQSRYFPTGTVLSEQDFEKLSSQNLGEKRRETRENLEKLQERAKRIIENLNNFSFRAFGEQFSAFRPGRPRRPAEAPIAGEPGALNSSQEGSDSLPRRFVNQFGGRKYPQKKSEIDFPGLGEVAVYYGLYIARLEAKEQAGTISCYMSSLMSLLKHKQQLRFSDITDLWLYKYEKEMRAQGRSATTISMYLRCLRRIFNMVIAKRIIARDLYPFGRDLYLIPAARKRKKALNIRQIQKLFEFNCEDPIRMMCKDLWFFMYIANGMNVKDMCLLTFGQISDRFCRFLRAKVINTTRENLQEITFFCDDFILEVMARHGNRDHAPENHIFPFLEARMDGYAIRHKVQLVTHLINKHMYAIARTVEVDFDPGTNDARHAFATQLKRAGKTTEFIRELIGHGTLKTTQDYLDDFEDITKTDIAETLLPFKEKKQGTTGTVRQVG